LSTGYTMLLRPILPG